MDISSIFALLPLVLKAINTVQEADAARKSGESVISIIQDKGPEILDLVTQVGAQLFPTLNAPSQAAAGALRFDPPLVAKIQTQLNSLGAKLVVDGDYGKNTKAAVTEFQKKSGLSADGWAGPITQAALDKAAPQ